MRIEDTWHGTISKPWDTCYWQLVHLEHEYSSYQVQTALDYCNMYANVTTTFSGRIVVKNIITWPAWYILVHPPQFSREVVTSPDYIFSQSSLIKMIMTQTYMMMGPSAEGCHRPGSLCPALSKLQPSTTISIRTWERRRERRIQLPNLHLSGRRSRRR